jgi:hypothetical protein
MTTDPPRCVCVTPPLPGLLTSALPSGSPRLGPSAASVAIPGRRGTCVGDSRCEPPGPFIGFADERVVRVVLAPGHTDQLSS